MRQLWCAFLLTVLISITGEAQTVRNVPANFATIQAAIVAAQSGDTVRVAPGTYVENINFLGKTITVVSIAGADYTAIDGAQNGPVVTFTSGEGLSSVLDGFTIRNGKAVSSVDGGGIRISGASPTVRHNRVVNNIGCSGVGIAINGGSPLIQGNVISGNTAPTCAGGTGGGGILLTVDGSAQILDNTISNNSTNSGAKGGGISLVGSNTPLIRGNIITGNSSSQGGGIALGNFSDAKIIQNVIAGNNAPNGGGGIYWLAPLGSVGPSVTNNTIVDNNSIQHGSAIFADAFDAAAPVKNNIIIGKTGQPAIYCGNFNDTHPPILAFNNVYAEQASAYAGICTDVTGTNGNISAAPSFVDRTAGNFRLVQASPGINLGDNSVPNLPALDLDSFPRILPIAGTVDMGAYEFATSTTSTISSINLTFADQDAGTVSAPLLVTLTNTGTATLLVNNVIVTGEFSQTNTCQTTIGMAPGESCTVSVRFAPAAGGPRSGQLTIAGNSGGNVVSLSGNGLAPLTLSATAISFGALRVGMSSSTTALILSNNGTTGLNLSSITTSGDFISSNDCPASLTAGSSCTINIRFAPTARQSRFGAVTINVPGSLYIVSLSGTGLAPTIDFSASNLVFGNLLIFGNQNIGSVSASQSVDVSNHGDMALTINSIVLTGQYTVTHDCGALLEVNGSCTMSVAFSPATLGTQIGAITISDDAIGSPHSIALNGFAVGAVLVLAPASVTFGNQAINTTSATRLVSLRNTGTVTMTTSSIAVSGEFSTSGSCNSLAVNAVCFIAVNFTPMSGGAKTGILTIADSAAGSPHTVPLSGMGVAASAALTVTRIGTGSGTVTSSPAALDCGATCIATFTSGQVVLLTTTPLSGSVFAGWSGDPDCMDGSVTMTIIRNCVARFDLPQTDSTLLRGDYDGDGKTDIAVYRPSSSEWFLRLSTVGYAAAQGNWYFQWGVTGDVPVSGDFDGDGKSEIAVYRPSTGEWLLRLSTQGYVIGAGNWYYQWGVKGDVPITGDYDGDGKTEIAVYRPSTGDWFLRLSTLGYVIGQGNWTYQWGVGGDQPVAGDFDGDRKTEIAVYRPSTGEWFLRLSTFGYAVGQGNWTYQWGVGGDQPVVGDFDGDGKSEIAVYRPSTGEWFLRLSTLGYAVGQGNWTYQWGIGSDVPIRGDFDGDAKAEIAVFRPSTGEWFFRLSSFNYGIGQGNWNYQWAGAGDLPLRR